MLINGKPLLGNDNISCPPYEVNILDYGDAITVIGTSSTGGAQAVSHYDIVYLDKNGTLTSSISFDAPGEGYELNWQPQDGVFVSDEFEEDGKRIIAQLSPAGVQILSKNIGKNEPAPDALCENMQQSLMYSPCATSTNCDDILEGSSQMDITMFYEAEADPRFDFEGFMTACKAVCQGKLVPSDDFSSQYCNASK